MRYLTDKTLDGMAATVCANTSTPFALACIVLLLAAMPSPSHAQVSDAIVVTATVLAPNTDQDTDDDGLLDSWELRHFGNLATATPVSDSDQDGFLDVDEFYLGTQPTNAFSLLEIEAVSFSGNSIQVTWASSTEPVPGYVRRYDLYEAPSLKVLSGPAATKIGNMILPDGEQTSHEYPAASDQGRFYGVRLHID